VNKTRIGVKVVGRPVCVWNIHIAGKHELEPLLGYSGNQRAKGNIDRNEQTRTDPRAFPHANSDGRELCRQDEQEHLVRGRAVGAVVTCVDS
jgi:hypothetical protein